MLPASSTAAAAAALLSVGGILTQLRSGDGHVYKMDHIISRQLRGGDDSIKEERRYYDGTSTFSAQQSGNSCEDPVMAWGQCGGQNYEGSTCCIDSYQCDEKDPWYSQCIPSLQERTNSFGPLDEDFHPSPAPTTVEIEGGINSFGPLEYYDGTSTFSAPQSGNSCEDPVMAWGQCGGQNYEGSTCCIDSYQCDEKDPWYSQCIPSLQERTNSFGPLDEDFNPSPAPTTVEDEGGSNSLGPLDEDSNPSPAPTTTENGTSSFSSVEEADPSPAPTTVEIGGDESFPRTQPPLQTPPPQTEPPQQPATGFYRPGPRRIHEALVHIATLEATGRPEDAAKVRAMVEQPLAFWVVQGADSTDTELVQEHMEIARDLGQIPILVLYNIPFRDCAGFSAGGARSIEEYGRWIEGVASAIGTGEAYVILEPDGLGIIPYAINIDDLPDGCEPFEADPATAEEERYEMTRRAVAVLKANPGTRVYIDGTHSDWHAPAEMAIRLVRANVQDADGFFLNVSNFGTTDRQIVHGERTAKCVFWGLQGNDMLLCTDNEFYAENVDPLIEEIGDDTVPHFVIDTSRNGNGVWTTDEDYPDPMAWCNPPTATLGHPTTTETDSPYADAYLWIKTPGESDGQCNRGLTDQGGVDPEWGVVDPNAGSWFPEQAEVLVGATGQ